MSNLRIGYLNRFDLATLTVSPSLAVPSLATYLQNDSRGDLLVAAASGSQVINGTWGGTVYEISQFTPWRYNLAASDTIRLQLYSDAAWTTQVYDSTALAAYTSGLFDGDGWVRFSNRYFGPFATVRSFKITTSSAAALQLSRVYLGPYTEVPINPAYGAILAPETLSRQLRSESGSLRTVVKPKFRSLTYDMMVRTEADRALHFEVSRYCDIDKALVASLFPGEGGALERDHTLFGKFEKPPAAKLSDWSQYDFSVKILEI